MKCTICRQGETRPGTATVTLERDGTTVVVRHVPARVCENCGEEYIEEREVRRLAEVAQELSNSGVRYELRDYVAA